MRYNKEQKASIWHFIKGSLFVGAFGILTAWIIFPLAWLFRNKGRDSIFWWWMDDERYNSDGYYADDYLAYLKLHENTYETFLTAYKWHNRNAVWNLKRDKFLVDSTEAEVGNNAIDVVSTPIDRYVKFNKNATYTKLDQTGIWIVDAGLKFIPESPEMDVWQSHSGDIISYYASIIGEGMMWFRAKGKKQLMFRYSQCEIVQYKLLGIQLWIGWRTIKLGHGNKSYVMTMKHQKIKTWA